VLDKLKSGALSAAEKETEAVLDSLKDHDAMPWGRSFTKKNEQN